MKITWPGSIGMMLLTVLNTLAADGDIQTGQRVCPQPTAPCLSASYTFQPHELSFPLPPALGWMTAYYSHPFYAVLLRSVRAMPSQARYEMHETCQGYVTEPARLQVQALFPERKVFASRFGCARLGKAWYTNTNSDYNFLAVYAGETVQEARQVLRHVHAQGFHDANMRQMQVVVDTSH